MDKDLEKKEFNKEIFLKTEEVTDEGVITAYLTTFENEDLVGDVIAKGALDEFVRDFDPKVKKLPMLYSHETSSIVGEWTELEIDSYGVKAKGIMYLEVTQANDVFKLLKRDAVASVSIGFSSNDWQFIDEDTFARKFNKITLKETSIVLNPCNPQAVILSVKSEDGLIETKALRKVLKEAGLSANEVTALFNEGWKGLKNIRIEEDQTDQLAQALKNFKF